MMLEQLADKEGLQAAAQELVERMRQQKLYKLLRIKTPTSSSVRSSMMKWVTR
jgi:hypothetical protein